MNNYIKDIAATQKNDNELLEFILKNRYYDVWKNWRDYIDNENESESISNKRNNSLLDEAKLELILTAKCNQHCEYCYWIKHPELYPAEYDKKDNVLKNLKTIFNTIINEDLYIPEIEYFTGEIWDTDYGLEVLEITYQALLNGLHTDVVLIPTNGSFMLKKEKMFQIQDYIDKFNECNVRLCLSLSIDGKIIEEKARPLNNKINVRDDKFYDDLFTFAEHNHFCFHPMVAAIDIADWIDNFNWWDKMCQEHGMNTEEAVMMLEVRNNNWTDQNIKDYNKFVDYLLDWHMKRYCDNDPKEFAKEMMLIRPMACHGYAPYSLTESTTLNACTINHVLMMRVGDFAIVPCHRTGYPQFLYGYLKIENDHIIGVEARNVVMAIRLLLMNNNMTLGCDTCIYNEYCFKGCHGSQFEATGDPFLPIPNICKFYKEKIWGRIKHMDELHIFDYIAELNSPYLISYPNNIKLLSYVEKIKQEHSKEV